MHALAVPAEARNAILAWYDASGRTLPFRGQVNPYAILVSEVMAQQTQISRVTQQWQAFMDTFPTVETLASAPTADVLRAWRGLGYNRRAVNLQLAARAIVAEHGGRVPNDLPSLLRLPGVGPYTARAVAALAFGDRVGAVDTNVRRVLSRLVVVDGPLPAGELQAIADDAVPRSRPADWTHALMDLGATVCRTRRPRCAECPAARWCRSSAGGDHARPRHLRPREPAFASTSRWLRGRILDQLRDVSSDEWAAIAGPFGKHDHAAIQAALRAMEGEGLIERDRIGRARLAR